jgi:putative methionine-R-sulfoxide reductase with GAF domain
MDPNSILDKGTSPEVPQGEPPQREWPGTGGGPPGPPEVRFPAEDGGKSLGGMAQRDLTAALQLLAERAQYITGATGAAIALRDHEEMVCRASAGPSAPEVGSQLQVNSGLSGESVRTRQTLRCDDAATDPRVNRESCEALGIASVVVMPLVQGDNVIGVFELFADKANAFEARDITALERMGTMVFTALEHAMVAQGLIAPKQDVGAEHGTPATDAGGGQVPSVSEPSSPGINYSAMEAPAERVTENPTAASSHVDLVNAVEAKAAAEIPKMASGIVFHRRVPAAAATPSIATSTTTAVSWQDESDDILADVDTKSAPRVEHTVPAAQEDQTAEIPVAAVIAPTEAEPDPVKVVAAPHRAGQEDQITAEHVFTAPPRSPVANLRKCEACGFPVSEGRQLCLDCEKKQKAQPGSAVRHAATSPAIAESGSGASISRTGTAAPVQTSTASATAETPIVSEGPRFLGDREEGSSWLANHKYMVGAIVIALAVIVGLFVAR